MARITIPFSSGVREDVDPRVFPDGALKRVENLRLTREGRLALRYGYTATTLTVPNLSGGTVFIPDDLISYGDRLLAAGHTSSFTGPQDLYEFVDEATFKWRPTDAEQEPRLCPVTGVRNVGRMPAQSVSVTACDVAAGFGLVCLVWQATADTIVHVFDPATDSTILVQKVTGMSAPRVVATGDAFFILGIVGAAVELRRFDKTVDHSLTTLTEAFSTGAAISAMDAAVATIPSSGFIVAIARNATPAVTLKLFGSTGTATQTITGPAVSMLTISVAREASRVHLVAAETADGHADLYTYLISGGAIENTTLNLAGGAATARQPGICVTGTNSALLITFENSASRTVYQVRLAPSTHVASTDRQWNQVSLVSKPVTCASTEVFGGIFAENASSDTNFVGVVGRGRSTATEMLGCVTDKGLAKVTSASVLPQIAKDASTGKFYWVRLTSDGDGRSLPVVAELLVNDTARRQSVAIDNALYMAGGVPQIFAGRQLIEAGYSNRPVIVSATPSNSTGTLTSGALYALAVVFEWYDEQGRFHASEPSDVTEVTMGGADDTITVVVTGPLSLRCNATNQAYGGAVKVVVYRSLAAPDKQLLRDNTSTIVPGTFGATVSIVLTQSDLLLADEAVVYTQGSSGARSGPNPFLSPFPCRYLAASGDKITSGGLPQDAQIQESRSAFPNEPITWAENLGGFGSAPERVLAVVRLDERRIVFTARAIYEFGGEGLDINGVGDLGFARRLPSPGGLYGGADGWRSLVETAIGVFFQLAIDSIYLLPRGGGAPMFIGKQVMDTLLAFPVITSASYLKNDQLVCFTCNNAAPDDSVILVYDLTMEQWFVDSESSALLAACEYQGRLVILRANRTIEFQNTSHPASTFITPIIETGTVYPFGKGGQGQIDEIQLFAEFRGACNVICSLSFDDGLNYTALTTEALTGLTVGEAVTLKWGPQRMRGDRVRLKFHTTDLSGATEQVAFHFATIDFTSSDRSALRNTTQKG